MLSITTLAVAGGTIWGSAKVGLLNQRQRSLVEMLLPTKADEYAKPLDPLVAKVDEAVAATREALAPYLDKTAAFVIACDDSWQKFVRNRIDPLLGGERHRQITDLDIGLSPREKAINRRLALSAVSTAVAVLGELYFPPLQIFNAGLMVYNLYPFLAPAFKDLFFEGKINYMIVGILGDIAMLAGGFFAPASLYGGVFVLTFKISDLTEHRFRRTLMGALGDTPQKVWAIVDGVEMEIPFADVAVGDILVVEAGQTVPVDGIVTGGIASIDQHMLTGESVPAEKEAGDQVLASTIVLAGRVYVRVEKAGLETTSAQIAAVLERTAGYRLNFISRIDAFANDMAGGVLATGLLAWATLGLQSMATILNCGVSTVARISGPVTMLNYLNFASQKGILIKDGRSFELLKEIDTIVFDKTGTLTLEQPTVCHVYPTEGMTKAELLMLAAAAERRQSHPIAKAIVEAAEAHGGLLPATEETQYEIGFGLKVRIADQEVLVGSQRFMLLEGVIVPDETLQIQAVCHEQGHSMVMVAIDKKLAGAIELQPTVRPEAKAAIQTLAARGLTPYIISGDQEAPTHILAGQLGIDHYFANVLPQDKAALVAKLQAEGRKVCFVGDGINDALALDQADVSVSLRGATTIATDTAQVVLMSQDLGHLIDLLEIAKEFNGTLRQLLIVALAPVSTTIAGVFLFNISIYTGIVIWQLGMLGGVITALSPLLKYRRLDAATPKRQNAPENELALSSEHNNRTNL
ncbi:MAG: heavy metal translocating P-type ATPase [Caldilineaceae bacterium]